MKSLEGQISGPKNMVTAMVYFWEFPFGSPCRIFVPNPYDEFSSVYENYSFDDEKYLYSDLATFRTPKLKGPKLKSEEILDVTGKKHALKRHYWFIPSTGWFFWMYVCILLLNPI